MSRPHDVGRRDAQRNIEEHAVVGTQYQMISQRRQEIKDRREGNRYGREMISLCPPARVEWKNH